MQSWQTADPDDMHLLGVMCCPDAWILLYALSTTACCADHRMLRRCMQQLRTHALEAVGPRAENLPGQGRCIEHILPDVEGVVPAQSQVSARSSQAISL